MIAAALAVLLVAAVAFIVSALAVVIAIALGAGGNLADLYMAHDAHDVLTCPTCNDR